MTLPSAADPRSHGPLFWGVKSSFRQYVTGLEDGLEVLGGGVRASDDGRLVFPQRARDSARASDEQTYAFGGTVTFSAHGGVLSVAFVDPRVHLDPSPRGTVSIFRNGSQSGERLVIASFTAYKVADERLLIPAPRLTWAGASLLGDVYDVGAVLDPIEIHLVPTPKIISERDALEPDRNRAPGRRPS